jgi:phosphotransferase system  glucose/maltose/N-acetylglucosamine-specific IIC component
VLRIPGLTLNCTDNSRVLEKNLRETKMILCIILAAVIAAINSWIHVLMYTYYKISLRGLNKHFSYKRFVTIMQMVKSEEMKICKI